MKWNFEPNWALVIFVFGFMGLFVSFVDGQSEGIGSKIPLAIFFIFVMSIGIILQMLPKEFFEAVYGESDDPGGFA